jgi:hypothetical protein
MRKTITLEVEVTFSESEEQRVIQAAREHYKEVGQARAPLDDEGERWREVPAEEFIPEAETAILELIQANDLFDKAGVEVTAASCLESRRQELGPQATHDTGLENGARLRGEVRGDSDADLDEFETGVYLCRWPNGDCSLVTANTRREALVQLDEWAGAHPSQLIPIDSCMVDFRLNDLGQIELGQFGEETEDIIWETCYPELRTFLSNVASDDGSEYTAEAKESIRQAVQHERDRLWTNQPECPQAETEFGRTLQKALRTVGPVADYYVEQMADQVLKSHNEKSRKPN